MNYVVWTYIARLVGLLLVLPSLMPVTFSRWLPSLEDRRVALAFCLAGLVVFASASLVYFILRNRDRKKNSL